MENSKQLKLEIIYAKSFSKTPAYIKAFCGIIISPYYSTIEADNLKSVLDNINSLLDRFEYTRRNSTESGENIYRKLYNDKFEIYTKTGENLIVTITFK